MVVPASATVEVVWHAALRRKGELLHKYSRRLTGRVSAVDRYRDVSMPIWMSDPVSILTKHAARLDTIIFVTEQSLLDRVFGSNHSSSHRVSRRSQEARAFNGRALTRRRNKRYKRYYRRTFRV